MMQTQTLMPVQARTQTQPRKRNLQDFLLSKLRRTRMGATVFLVNGFQIRGEIRGYEKGAGYEYVRLGAYPYEADGTEAPVLWRVLEKK